MTVAAAPTRIIALLLLFIPLLLQAEDTISLFTPPREWTPVDNSLLAPHVKVGFFTKSKKEFCPSINLSEEKISISKKEYLKTVQKLHQSDPKNRWRSLGELPTKEGKISLSSIDMETPLGEVRLLQAIFCKEDKAYILTGASLLEEFSKYQKEFLSAFKSFRLIKASRIEEKSSFLSSLSQDKKSLQKALEKESQEGSYYQLLILNKAN